MKARIYSFNKESNKKDNRLFDKLYRDLNCATRADDKSKLLPASSRELLANLFAMIQANPNKVICINQDFISDITGTKKDQNKRLLSQLSDFIDYKYHRAVRYEGKRYNYTYIIKFTEDGELRATNPELFYVIDSKINLKKSTTIPEVTAQKCALINAKMRSSYIDIKDIKKEIEDIPRGYHSISKIKKEKIKIKKKESPTLPEIKTCATSFINELAHVTQEKPRLMTGKEEKAHLRNQQERNKTVDTHENTEFNPIASFVDKLVSSACKKGEDFQLGVETPDKDSPLEPVLDMPNPAVFNNQKNGNEMEQKEEEKIVNSDQVEEKQMLLTKKISSSFGQDKANEILDNLEFKYVKPNKVAIESKFGFLLSELEKRKIRAAVEAVYGESIKIVAVTTTTKIGILPEKKKPIATPSYYNKFQELKDNYKGEKVAFLDKFIVPSESNAEKLVFRGWIKDFYQNNEIIESVLKTDVIAEFWYKNDTSPDFILSPQKIKKDREYWEKLSNPDNQKFILNHEKLHNFNEILKRFLPEKSADYIIDHYFRFLQYSKESSNNHLILGGGDYEINDLLNYLPYIEKVANYTNSKIELRYLTNSQLPIIITKK